MLDCCRVSNRVAIDATLFVLRSGCQWNALNGSGIFRGVVLRSLMALDSWCTRRADKDIVDAVIPVALSMSIFADRHGQAAPSSMDYR